MSYVPCLGHDSNNKNDARSGDAGEKQKSGSAAEMVGNEPGSRGAKGRADSYRNSQYALREVEMTAALSNVGKY